MVLGGFDVVLIDVRVVLIACMGLSGFDVVLIDLKMVLGGFM